MGVLLPVELCTADASSKICLEGTDDRTEPTLVMGLRLKVPLLQLAECLAEFQRQLETQQLASEESHSGAPDASKARGGNEEETHEAAAADAEVADEVAVVADIGADVGVGQWESIHFHEEPCQMTAANWSPGMTDSMFLAGDDAGDVHVWQACGTQWNCQTLAKGHYRDVTAVAWSPKGSTLLTGSEDGTVIVWEAVDGLLQWTLASRLTGHTAAVRSVAWSPEGTELVTGSSDKSIQFWDCCDEQQGVVTWKKVEGGLFRQEDSVDLTAWSPDGQQMLVGCSHCPNIRILGRTSSGAGHWCELEELRHGSDEVLATAWSPEGNMTLTGTSGSSACIWRPRRRNDLKKPMRWNKITTLRGHAASVTAVAWSPQSTEVITGSADRTTVIWQAEEDDIAYWKAVAKLDGHSASIRCVQWAAGGSRLLTIGDDRTWHVWQKCTSPRYDSPYPADLSDNLASSHIDYTVDVADYGIDLSPNAGKRDSWYDLSHGLGGVSSESKSSSSKEKPKSSQNKSSKHASSPKDVFLQDLMAALHEGPVRLVTLGSGLGFAKRYNSLYHDGKAVNNGSWSRWLESLEEIEIEKDYGGRFHPNSLVRLATSTAAGSSSNRAALAQETRRKVRNQREQWLQESDKGDASGKGKGRGSEKGKWKPVGKPEGGKNKGSSAKAKGRGKSWNSK